MKPTNPQPEIISPNLDYPVALIQIWIYNLACDQHNAGIFDMAKQYFTLLARDNAESPWGIEFGDYDRDTVESELQDYRDHDVKAKNLKIVKTANASNAAIYAVVAKLNATVKA